jgi:hypothetical protein
MDWHNVLVVLKLIVNVLYGKSMGSYIDVLEQRNFRASESNIVCQKMLLVTIRYRAMGNFCAYCLRRPVIQICVLKIIQDRE